jgi:hypothetical protein
VNELAERPCSQPVQTCHRRTSEAERLPGPSDAGCVVLDIGPGSGAAIVTTSRALNGREIEVREIGRPWDGTHVAVRQRDGGGTSRYAAIFGSLVPGHYEFRLRPGRSSDPALVVDVAGASVTLAHWPEDGTPESGLAVGRVAQHDHEPSTHG